MNSDRQVRPARLVTYLRGHRPLLAVFSLLVVVAVPVLLAAADGGSSEARTAPQTVLASATNPVTDAASTATSSIPRNVADTTVPTTVPPTTAPPPPPPPPVTEPPVTEPPAPPPPPAPEPQATGNTMTVTSTAYCGGGTTASGESAHEGGVAMNSAPLGSTWRVVGSGATYTVNDRIGSGSEFDIYFSSCGAADGYGRQTITIEQVG